VDNRRATSKYDTVHRSAKADFQLDRTCRCPSRTSPRSSGRVKKRRGPDNGTIDGLVCSRVATGRTKSQKKRSKGFRFHSGTRFTTLTHPLTKGVYSKKKTSKRLHPTLFRTSRPGGRPVLFTSDLISLRPGVGARRNILRRATQGKEKKPWLSRPTRWSVLTEVGVLADEDSSGPIVLGSLMPVLDKASGWAKKDPDAHRLLGKERGSSLSGSLKTTQRQVNHFLDLHGRGRRQPF